MIHLLICVRHLRFYFPILLKLKLKAIISFFNYDFIETILYSRLPYEKLCTKQFEHQ